MVPPSAFADTATPPIFSPPGEVTVPASWACAAKASEPRKPISSLMTSSSIGLRRDALQIGDDRVDLLRLEVVLESRHFRRAVGDEHAQRLVLALERRARQHRRVLGARHLRLGVADAA